MKRTPGNAFTLIELLVVVTIIIALLAIVLPSLSRASSIAMRAVCASNLHQASAGFMLYAADNRATLPDTDPNNGNRNHFLHMWNRRVTDTMLSRYLGAQALGDAAQSQNASRVTSGTRVLICPVMESDIDDATVFSRWNESSPGAWWNYDLQIFGSSYISTTTSKLAETGSPSTDFNSASLLRRGDQAYVKNLSAPPTRVMLADTLYHEHRAISPTWNWTHQRAGHPSHDEGKAGSGYSSEGGNQARVDNSVTWASFGDMVNGETQWYDMQDDARVFHTFPGGVVRGYFWHDPQLQ